MYTERSFKSNKSTNIFGVDPKRYSFLFLFLAILLWFLKVVNIWTPQETKNETTAPPTEASPTGGSSEEEPEEGCMAIGRNLESRQAIAAAIQKLGLELLQNLERTPDKPNIIISPLSISLALSQLALGVRPDHILLKLLRSM